MAGGSASGVVGVAFLVEGAIGTGGEDVVATAQGRGLRGGVAGASGVHAISERFIAAADTAREGGRTVGKAATGAGEFGVAAVFG